MHSPAVSRFVDVSCELLARGYGVRFRASGGSMQPAICDGDVITIAPATTATLTAGNVVLYRRCDRLFAHRVVSAGPDSAGRQRVLLRGDAAADCDPPVTPGQVVGELVAVTRRHGRSGLLRVSRLMGRVLQGCRRVGAGITN